VGGRPAVNRNRPCGDTTVPSDNVLKVVNHGFVIFIRTLGVLQQGWRRSFCVPRKCCCDSVALAGYERGCVRWSRCERWVYRPGEDWISGRLVLGGEHSRVLAAGLGRIMISLRGRRGRKRCTGIIIASLVTTTQLLKLIQRRRTRLHFHRVICHATDVKILHYSPVLPAQS